MSDKTSPLAWPALGIAAVAFAVLTYDAWLGRLGFVGLAWLSAAGIAFWFGRRGLAGGTRQRADLIAKLLFTIVGMIALLRHPVPVGDGQELPIYDAIIQYLPYVDTRMFVIFGLLAMLIKAVGVVSSAYGWHLLLVGQGVRYPFWSAIMTAFLIGRFIGTFLPSTIGLDGYTLYEAGRYSNQWSRAVTAKALEKLIGVTGLFLGMVLTLPWGYQVLVDVSSHLDRPGTAPLFAALIALIGGGVSLGVVLILVWPRLLTTLLIHFGRLLPGGVRAKLENLTRAVGAYHGQIGLLFAVLFAKFVTHFTTAVVYYFTALAIGVVGAQFWPIVFGSTIQIFGTILAPTIAGEGAREAFQALLLSKHLGGVAQAVLSAALGFIAAEAATLWGGLFMLVRKPGWRPAFTVVDGQQVDYAWIDDSEPVDLSDAAKMAAASAGR
ncbi:MAG: lysylphosphatidylglycerol synthase transmembrane domain-containing protein [Deltaproteobacteria bacterium]|nr:lysylphosphatidylglycerol synthase transmembrane domain-containing protein [Deltaproteobacteria bacterium]